MKTNYHGLCLSVILAYPPNNFPNKLPLFGQLQNIFLANEEIIFEYTPLATLVEEIFNSTMH
jgi:hypothetical protein